ncbi:hypothetical protein MKY51_06805 [Solibacillus sp. FSL R5-0691]|uniref:hypothetical protein n=1 Tax=Solibacillus sp. FSL R5-0691 TaxID=2921653 RepID=UPI0030CD4357
MKKTFTYIPVLCCIGVILFIESTLLKWILLVGIGCLMVLAKYRRSKLMNDEFEFDDRVNANITKWSLRSMFILNTMLIMILVIGSQGVLEWAINIEWILIYLIVTLCIPFYIVPAVIKNF